MGFQDRDYVRGFGYNDGGYLPRRGEMMMVTKIIIINFALFFINGLLTEDNFLFGLMSVYGWTLGTPLYWWQCLTYGFAHSPNDLWHIGGNMLSLFFLGYAVEERLGAWEFLRFYLVTIILGGIAYSALNWGTGHSCLGASGGVTGVVMLFILWYPRRTLLLWGVMPIPAWVIGAFIVGSEVMGLLGSGRGDVAYSVHLVGIAAAFSYMQWRKRFGNLGDLPRLLTGKHRGGRWWKQSVQKKQNKPTMRVYDPLDDDDDAWLERRVNEILKKYAECGEAGLNDEERSILKQASAQYREKYKSEV